MRDPDAPLRVALRLVIRGRVQGVGYRDSCRYVAAQHHVDGWVRNRSDGSVEAWLEGALPDVDAVAGWCQRGPRHASVTGVEVHDERVADEVGFHVR